MMIIIVSNSTIDFKIVILLMHMLLLAIFAVWLNASQSWCRNEQICQRAVMLTPMREVLRLPMLCTSYLFIFRHHA